MKANLKGSMIFLILIFALILSISMVSANEDLGLEDIDDSANIELSEANPINPTKVESDFNSANNSISTDNNAKEYELDNDLKTATNSKNKLELSKVGQVIRVDHTGNDANDIQSAINIASAGDIIQLGEYTYTVNYAQLNITKNITLKGEGNGTIINGYGYAANTEGNSSYGSVLFISKDASGAKIDGIRFNNMYPNLQYTDWDTLYGWALVINSGAKNCTVTDCSFINFNHGVSSYASGTVIKNSYFTGAATRIMQTKVSGSGQERGTKCIQINETTGCIISNNVFDGPVLDAILLNYDCFDTEISNNKFINNAYSIYLYGLNEYTYNDWFSRRTLIANNTFTNCGRFDGDYYGYEVHFEDLGIINGEQTILADLIIKDNIFNLNENTTVINTFLYDYYTEALCVKGNITISNNQFNLLSDELDGSSITILRYNEGMYDSLALEKDIEITDNVFADGIFAAFFIDYDNEIYDYWTSYFGDLIIPATGTFTKSSISSDNYLTVGDSNTIQMRLTDAESNNLNADAILIIDDGTSVERHGINFENGQASYKLSNLTEGTYYIGVGFGGNSTHYSSYAIDSFNVSRKNTDLKLALNKNSKVFLDETITLRINLSDEDSIPLNETVEVKINDKSYSINTTNGLYDLQLDLSSILNNKTGLYTIEAQFNGSNKYNESSNSVIFNVLARNTYLSILAPETSISGDFFNITLSLTDFNRNPLNGTVELRINNELTEANIIEGSALVNKVLVEKGNYTIEASYKDTDYGYSYDSTNIEILGKPSNLTIAITSLGEAKHNVSINLKSKDYKLSGAVIINVDNELYKVVYVENGEANFIIEDIGINGNHNLIVEYYGDNIYAGSNASKQFTIKFNNDTTVKVNHTGNDLADLQRTIDNANSGDIINLENYVFSDISNLNITKDITLISNGSSIFSAGDNKPIFNVLSSDISVNISSLSFLLSDNDTVVALNEDDVTNVLFVLSNNTVDTKNNKVKTENLTLLHINKELNKAFENGIVIMNNSLISGAKAISLISLIENNTNASNDTENQTLPPNSTDNDTNKPNETVIVKKASQIIYSDMTTTAVIVDADGRIGDYFIFKLVDSENNPLGNKFIQVGFNGKIYNRTTDEKGEAKLQINLAAEGLYTFAVCFLGDDEYNASFVVSKITVKAQTPKLTTSAKTYKASAKTKTLTATFKTAKGNPVSGKKISFTLNGKTYTAKTNSKGIASVNVSLSTKKTYSFTVKFAGDNKFKQATTSSKVTIK